MYIFNCTWEGFLFDLLSLMIATRNGLWCLLHSYPVIVRFRRQRTRSCNVNNANYSGTEHLWVTFKSLRQELSLDNTGWLTLNASQLIPSDTLEGQESIENHAVTYLTTTRTLNGRNLNCWLRYLWVKVCIDTWSEMRTDNLRMDDELFFIPFRTYKLTCLSKESIHAQSSNCLCSLTLPLSELR